MTSTRPYINSRPALVQILQLALSVCTFFKFVVILCFYVVSVFHSLQNCICNLYKLVITFLGENIKNVSARCGI